MTQLARIKRLDGAEHDVLTIDSQTIDHDEYADFVAGTEFKIILIYDPSGNNAPVKEQGKVTLVWGTDKIESTDFSPVN